MLCDVVAIIDPIMSHWPEDFDAEAKYEGSRNPESHVFRDLSSLITGSIRWLISFTSDTLRQLDDHGDWWHSSLAITGGGQPTRQVAHHVLHL